MSKRQEKSPPIRRAGHRPQGTALSPLGRDAGGSQQGRGGQRCGRSFFLLRHSRCLHPPCSPHWHFSTPATCTLKSLRSVGTHQSGSQSARGPLPALPQTQRRRSGLTAEFFCSHPRRGPAFFKHAPPKAGPDRGLSFEWEHLPSGQKFTEHRTLPPCPRPASVGAVMAAGCWGSTFHMQAQFCRLCDVEGK